MTAEKIDIPDELMILNPEFQKKPVVIGKEAYMVYPLTEGQTERVSRLIADLMSDITSMDMQCPKCKNIFPNMLGEQETCGVCKGEPRLISMQKSPIEALTCEERVPKLIQEVVGIPAKVVKESLTIPQAKHVAAVLFEQNFKDESNIPEESGKNFQALLDWMGLGAEAKAGNKAEIEKTNTGEELEKSMKPLPMNTDSPESTSKEDGKKKAMEGENIS